MEQQANEKIEVLLKRISENRDDADTWFELGSVYFDQKCWAEAINAYENTIRLNPDQSAAYYNIGLAYMRMEQYEDAILAFQHSISITPDQADAYYNLGECYTSIGRDDLTLDAINIATQIDPKDYLNFEMLGDVYKRLQKYDEAIAAFQQARNLTDFPFFDLRLGQLLEKQQRYDEVIALYRKAAETDTHFFLHLGGVYQRLRRYEDAAEMLQKARYECAFPQEIYDVLISGYSPHRYEEALQTVAILKKNPDNISHTSYALGFIYQQLGQYEESIRAFHCIIQEQHHRVDIHIEIGIDYYFLQQYERATVEIQKGIANNYSDSRACYYLSLSYWKAGQTEQAIEIYNRLASFDAEMALRLYRESGGFNDFKCN